MAAERSSPRARAEGSLKRPASDEAGAGDGVAGAAGVFALEETGAAGTAGVAAVAGAGVAGAAAAGFGAGFG